MTALADESILDVDIHYIYIKTLCLYNIHTGWGLHVVYRDKAHRLVPINNMQTPPSIKSGHIDIKDAQRAETNKNQF